MNGFYPLVVVAPVIGLAAYCLGQITVARSTPGRGPYHSLCIGFLVGLVVVGAVAAWAAGRMDVTAADRGAYLALDVLTYLALAFGYFNFVNLTVASLRIRLLEELTHGEGLLSREALLQRHSSANVVALRLDRLIRGGHLVDRNGRLFSGRLAFLLVARIFDGLRWAIIGHHLPRE